MAAAGTYSGDSGAKDMTFAIRRRRRREEESCEPLWLKPADDSTRARGWLTQQLHASLSRSGACALSHAHYTVSSSAQLFWPLAWRAKAKRTLLSEPEDDETHAQLARHFEAKPISRCRGSRSSGGARSSPLARC